MIKKRSIGLVILLSFVTFGIYTIVLFCKMGSEVNKICEGDGKRNMFYLLAVLLGLVTFGIYPLVWCCKAMDRLQDNSYRYGPTVHPTNSGASFILWTLLGSFIAVGPIVALCKFVKDINAFAGVAGNITPLPYTKNQVERIALAENNKFIPLQQNQSQQINQAAPVNQIPAQRQQATISDTVPATVPATNFDGTVQNAVNAKGSITCVKGMYAGYDFPILANDEIIIGKNPATCSIVIDTGANYVSSKHCLIKYNANDNTYCVVDYSTNGTFTSDGIRFEKNMPKTFRAGTTIYLGTADNMFRLG